MATAYILINTEVAAEEEVLEKLKKLPEVKEAHLVYGIYDLIAKVEAETLETLKEDVTKHLRSLDKVRSTMTMICVD